MAWKVSSGGVASSATSAVWQQRQQNLQALSKALQAGDLDSAKTAYASLTKNAPSGATANPGSPLAQLGQALQSGDLASAQQAFSQMRGHRHATVAGISSTSAAPTAATDTLGNQVNVYA